MDLSSIAVAGPLFTSGAALIVGLVTRWTQRGVARDRIKWEARLEVAKHNQARFATALEQLIQAADAANRYVVRSSDIDINDWDAREPYILPILDPIGRARVEVAALPPFLGEGLVNEAIATLERLVEPHETGKALRQAWQPDLIGRAITALSMARNSYMELELGLATASRAHRLWANVRQPTLSARSASRGNRVWAKRNQSRTLDDDA
ncbi:hypothetical protein ABT133_29280 [Streptomyces sp. NPDC001835]|uniref:hypothetical protein n=1 Tax=Streptomyces sp. NPDC001835 TaxID=3154528 RepID=UPI003319D1F1